MPEKKHDCECGCGGTTGGGRFLPGHDSKLKSRLISEALDGDKKAESELRKRGWHPFLERKREALRKGRCGQGRAGKATATA